MGIVYLISYAQPVTRPHRCANCAIEFAWIPVRAQDQEYCCAGCADGGPCACDYGALADQMAQTRTAHHLNVAAVHPEAMVRGEIDVADVKIRPVGDRVVVKPTAKEEVSKGGIIIPDTAKEKPQEGTVIAVGAGKLLDNGDRSTMELKVGDKVLFAKYGGTEFKYDGDDLLVLRESDVLAVLPND
jgi:chaperonin GroES